MSRRPPVPLADAARAVVARLREHGHEAFWAGGCVRDMLLGRPPEDIDIATSAPPEAIVRLFPRTREVGVSFGVVLVREGGHWLEVATFRSETDYLDGRRPERVVFTSTAEEDCRRRDFTINGLFYDPLREEVIDYVGGQEDLKAGLIRAIGDPRERFAEDHLRMVRAVRFAARLGFTVEPATAAAIRDLAAHIRRISPERIREELVRILGHPSRAVAFDMLCELRLWEHLPVAAAGDDDRRSVIRAMLAALPPDSDWVVALAVILADRGGEAVIETARALRCSTQEIRKAAWLVNSRPLLDRVAAMSDAAFKRLAAQGPMDDLLDLHEAWCRAHGQPLENNAAARARWSAIPADQLAPPPLVTGDDLLRAGLPPGPHFRDLLDAAYDAQLNGQVRDRAEALALLQRLIAASSPVPPAGRGRRGRRA